MPKFRASKLTDVQRELLEMIASLSAILLGAFVIIVLAGYYKIPPPF